MTQRDLEAVREELVLRHVEAENDRDLDAVMATFARPRYEIVPTGAVYDGEAAVRAMLLAQWEEMPTLRFAAEAVFHSSTGLVVETTTTSTGPASVGPRGSGVAMRSMNLFGFEGEDLVLERCYFDRMLFAECFIPHV